MPIIKVDGGYKIRRSAGGLFPKVYATREAAEIRVEQMEKFKHMKGSRVKGGGAVGKIEDKF